MSLSKYILLTLLSNIDILFFTIHIYPNGFIKVSFPYLLPSYYMSDIFSISFSFSSDKLCFYVLNIYQIIFAIS